MTIKVDTFTEVQAYRDRLLELNDLVLTHGYQADKELYWIRYQVKAYILGGK